MFPSALAILKRLSKRKLRGSTRLHERNYRVKNDLTVSGVACKSRLPSIPMP
jgi:hypothetical protein